jgi:hypothetical protein
MLVYISGPIDGLPDRNEKAFRAAERYLNTLGYETLVPLDVPAFEHRNGEAKCPRGYTDGGGHSSACWIRGDLLAMLETCDAIFMMNGWEMSRGANLEFDVAVLSGFKVFHSGSFIPRALAL